MFDLARVDSRALDVVSAVVDEITRVTSIDPSNILLAGAMARDTLHAALGHDFLLKETRGTDLGLAVSDWAVINKIDAAFKRTGSNGIRYVIAATPVDVMPFGPIEDPRASRPRSDAGRISMSSASATSTPRQRPCCCLGARRSVSLFPRGTPH